MEALPVTNPTAVDSAVEGVAPVVAADAPVESGIAKESEVSAALPAPVADVAPEAQPTEVAPTADEVSTAPLDLPVSDEAATKPIEHVESGIQPLAPFLDELEKVPEQTPVDSATTGTQEEASTLPVQVNGDTVMTESKEAQVPEAVVSEEPASATGLDGTVDTEAAVEAFPTLSSEDVTMADATTPATKVPREREDDDEAEPSAKRARTEDPAAAVNETLPTSEQPAVPSTEIAAPVVPSTEDATPTPAAPAQPASAPAAQAAPVVDFGSMTESQHKIIESGIRNLKKSRNAVMFHKPVDPVALNIPRYLEVITQPMDLSTMERKIRNREYKSVNEYVADFDLMVQNSRTFNGATHPVTQAGSILRSQLDAQLRKVPRPGAASAASEPAPKKKKTPAPSALPLEPKQRRQSKVAPPPAASPSTAVKEETYALDNDGMPTIRRMSTSDGRPKREIKAPARELPYSAKPKKKKYQAELKYCLEVLDEFKKPKWIPTVAPFAIPVDPVALNIPNYRSIVKKPMDLSTIRDKLAQGHYDNAKDFEQDFHLMCENCYKFNGKDHVVSKMAQDMEAQFNTLMSRKNDWLAKHAPRSAPQSPEAPSDAESEEEEEEDEEDDAQEQFAAINKQMQALTEQLMQLQQKGKMGKTKEKKSKSSGKISKKNSLGGGALPVRAEKKSKTKTSSKPVKPITTAQKEEISNKIGMLDGDGIAQAANIIKTALRKAGKHEMAEKAEDEMEFEIDEIPDEALHELLKLVRKATSSEVPDDTDYKPAKAAVAANSGKSRKNKPMSKFEQEDRINKLKSQIDSFKNGGNGSSPDAAQAAPESSDDDDESGSESEEE